MELSARKELILSAIVEFYIATGEPISSRLIVTALPYSVSSATVRNEMAELTGMGYLEQPHTSAGRVPSDKGVRYYVDRLLKSFRPSASEVFRVLSGVDRGEGDAVRILTQACDVLSELTGMAAVAATPVSPRTVIRNVQIMPMGGKNVLVAISTSSGVLKSRIAKLERPADYSLMELFYNVAAANFTGAPCADVNRARLQTITASLGPRAFDLAPLLVCLAEAADESDRPDVLLRGTAKLSRMDLGAEIPQIIELASRREAFCRLLGAPAPEEISLKIGGETRLPFLRGCAVITTGYQAGESGAGVIGVLGSIKTDYAHTIPLVKYLGSIVGKLISENLRENEEKTT